MGELYREVRRLKTLEAAWRKVARRSLNSQSEEVRADAERFRDDLIFRLKSIQSRLIRRSFHFSPQTGVLKPRPGKRPRPIVIAPSENRVVQRAILDVAQKQCPAVRRVLETETSVGGIAGVDKAIGLVLEALSSGSSWYIRSDIPDFFTKIPREDVVSFVRRECGDDDFADLFDSAVETELLNGRQLEEELDLFPLSTTGVAQGSALSPLVGNILLNDFDQAMNGRGVVCIRYIDDFIILGPSRTAVQKAFANGLSILERLGLSAYDPTVSSEKAQMGHCADGITFLGCHVVPGLVQPSRKARQRLLDRVDDVLAQGRRDIDGALKRSPLKGQKYAQTLTRVDRIVKGWGDAYHFCNGRPGFAALDSKIDEKLAAFRAFLADRTRGRHPLEIRRALGVTVLADLSPSSLRHAKGARSGSPVSR